MRLRGAGNTWQARDRLSDHEELIKGTEASFKKALRSSWTLIYSLDQNTLFSAVKTEKEKTGEHKNEYVKREKEEKNTRKHLESLSEIKR